ncbi:sensor histidine kinase [Flavobacterium sp. H4147]|uniref:sensor histidine kinase n=1 Tax=Flavobacterium sp. H4147 TaxID=3034149 RepID=UPI0023EE1940|nr:ATP-binding protein [Flavobacterium sp. H4147]
MKQAETEEKLKERIKELTCLFEITKTISQATAVESAVLKKVILSTKNAWRFHEEVIVEILAGDFYLTTSKLPQKTIFLVSDIPLPDKEKGFIKVHYPTKNRDVSVFIDEEQELLNTIAVEVGFYIEKFHTLEKKKALRRTIERIDRLSLLGEMTTGIAHELNNPLANILGYAELIKAGNSDPEIDSDISTIINSVIYSREIVKKLLFFSQEIPQQLKMEEIQPLFIFALSFLKQNFQKKEIKSELIFRNTVETIKVDSVQLTQVLFNLLINAIQASSPKSTIKTIVENNSDFLFIRIEDEGCGISADIKSKIFEPFFTTKSPNEGNGLGLSVVYGIVKNHNGEVLVEDNLPKGTIFTVKLPLS